MPSRAKGAGRQFTVPVVWRKIVKKNELQGTARYDVLICNHVVPADADNTYRRARSCPECRLKVQEYADLHQAPGEERTPRAKLAGAAPSRKPVPRKPPTRHASPGWCVYILRCGDGSLYTGSTNDLARRVARHSAGAGARYTRSRLPVVLVHEERVGSRSAALRRELAVKRLARAAKLALIAASPARSKRRSRKAGPVPA